jgi:hypothetical protein
MKYNISNTDDLQGRLFSRLRIRLWGRIYEGNWNRLQGLLDSRWIQLKNRLWNRLEKYEV